jgi:L-2,4-diaminobutyrate decarboxylase
MIENNGKAYLEIAQKIIGRMARYLDESSSGSVPVVQLRSQQELMEMLKLDDLIANGLSTENVEELLETYLAHTMHLHHPAYMGHQVAVPHIGSAFAEMIHGIANQPMSIYEMGPAAACMEQFVINWMLDKVGWSEEGGGVLTHGGSLANITALLSARAKAAPEAWRTGTPDNLIVLAPENAHYSISRAVSILGLGSDSIVEIPTSADEVIIPGELQRIYLEQIQQGRKIMAVVANGCATSTGYFDPLREIGMFCREHDLWFHVDSPHGATALLSEKYIDCMDGIELADSMVWDAHKMMRTSTLCTVVLYKERYQMLSTFTQKASYLFHEKEMLGEDTMGYQVECTKAGLGVKFYWVLAAYGEEGLGKYYETLCDHAKQFYTLIISTPGFECLPPQSNILCFRYQPELHDQLTLREALIREGQYYISTTEIKGKRFLRLVIMNESTSKTIISGLLAAIKRISQASEAD